MQKYLSKNDFSRWMKCPTAAYYGWSGLESKNESDAFLRYLAEEGQTVGRMARRLFANAEFIEEKVLEAAYRTTRARIQNDCTLFEACVIQGDFVVRPDILIRKDSSIYIIEVKSKVGNLRQHREGKMPINMYGDVRAAYKEIVHDLAFQVEVLRLAFPDLTVVPYFLLPEGSALSNKEEVVTARREEQIVLSGGDSVSVNRRRSDSVLKFFPTEQAIQHIKASTVATMDAMAVTWKSGERPAPQLKYGCRNCEFRLKEQESGDGFHRCWGRLAEPTPHIFDLHQLYSLKLPDKKQALLRCDESLSRNDNWKRGRLLENEGSHRHFAPQLRHPRHRESVDHL